MKIWCVKWRSESGAENAKYFQSEISAKKLLSDLQAAMKTLNYTNSQPYISVITVDA